MGKRFKNTLYTIEDIKYIDGRHSYVRNDDETLFSGRYRTKIKPEDLPEWYLYGRYYRRFGYMSTTGITDMVYIPSRFSNHYLKNDCLLISYGGKITEKENSISSSKLELYEGWAERVWDNEIITILCGARKFSDYDIAPFIEQLKWKKEYMKTEFLDEFSPKRWDIDVDLLFVEPLKCPECNKSMKIMRYSDCNDGGCDVIGHCIFCLQDWEWHCNKKGWPSDMKRFFHG